MGVVKRLMRTSVCWGSGQFIGSCPEEGRLRVEKARSLDKTVGLSEGVLSFTFLGD